MCRYRLLSSFSDSPVHCFVYVPRTAQPARGTLLHHWCGSCIKRGDLLREAVAWLGNDAWMQRDGMQDTPLHSLCANPSLDLGALEALADVIPPHVWRARGREGTPLHLLCRNGKAVSGAVLRAASASWQDDDLIALLQSDHLGRTPVQLLWEACHDVSSSAARPLPPLGEQAGGGALRELDYADYHSDGNDALYVAAQMAACAAAVAAPVREKLRREVLQELVRCLAFIVMMAYLSSQQGRIMHAPCVCATAIDSDKLVLAPQRPIPSFVCIHIGGG
jgi:hypothetical protein